MFYTEYFGHRSVNSFASVDSSLRAALRDRGLLRDAHWPQTWRDRLTRLHRGLRKAFPTEVRKKPAFPPAAIQRAYTDTNWNDFRHVQGLLLVSLGTVCLLRRSEVTNLRWGDVTLGPQPVLRLRHQRQAITDLGPKWSSRTR